MGPACYARRRRSLLAAAAWNAFVASRGVNAEQGASARRANLLELAELRRAYYAAADAPEPIDLAERRAARDVQRAWGEVFEALRIAIAVVRFGPEVIERAGGQSHHAHEWDTGHARLNIDAGLPAVDRDEAIAKHIAAITRERAERREAVV